jgi:hypothetical protein
MRILNGVVCAILVLFAAVQYNDPDALFWGTAYGVAALWCGLAAARPAMLARAPLNVLVGLSALAALGGMIWFWPDTPNWWRREVWWVTETAREGMGMMIVFAALLLSGVGMLLGRRRRGKALT